jgi:glycosyltransferase involved in cell wall biosynthesis
VRLVVERPPTDVDEAVVLLDRWNADADLTILQHSIGSFAAGEIARRRIPVVLNYHNITPPDFVEAWEPAVSAELDHGRRQLVRLCHRARAGVADSEFNAAELRDLGLENVVVAPVLFSALSADGAADRVLSAGCGSDGGGLLGGGDSGVSSPATMLFVGRLSPNKCQQDLVASLAAVRGLGVEARLVLVGAVSSVGFVSAVEALAVELGVADSVVVAGSVSEAALAGWYEAADVFVCVSEHEGFCVPLVEAMGFGVPVVAFGAAAVPETLAGAGLVLEEKSPVSVASAVVRVLSDVGVREGLVARGRVRAAELGLASSRERMRAVLGPMLEDLPT